MIQSSDGPSIFTQEIVKWNHIKESRLVNFFSFTSNLHYALFTGLTLFTILTLQTTATVHKVLTLQWTKNVAAILMGGHVNGVTIVKPKGIL